MRYEREDPAYEEVKAEAEDYRQAMEDAAEEENSQEINDPAVTEAVQRSLKDQQRRKKREEQSAFFEEIEEEDKEEHEAPPPKRPTIAQ